ncbi:MAG: SRPBCC family protein [Nitrospirota bacterium]
MRSDNPTRSDRRDLVITRVFAAPLPLVWKAWTDPDEIMRWWGPTGFTCPVAKMDVREGGTSLVCMRAPRDFGGQDMYSTWRYRTIVPMERIEYIHNLADEKGRQIDPTSIGMPADFPQDLRNLVTFRDLGNGRTELTVTEYDWPVGRMMEMSKMGMEQCLDKMAATFPTGGAIK